jgi:hypothetical protein
MYGSADAVDEDGAPYTVRARTLLRYHLPITYLSLTYHCTTTTPPPHHFLFIATTTPSLHYHTLHYLQEYLMRCQWGTTFDNMQPWIVAHRYKEFDSLDTRLKNAYPTFINQIPKLPKKDIFSYLDTTVIAKRRKMLEDYMTKVVLMLPAIMRKFFHHSTTTISPTPLTHYTTTSLLTPHSSPRPSTLPHSTLHTPHSSLLTPPHPTPHLAPQGQSS